MSLNGLATGPAPNGQEIEYNGWRFPRGALTEEFTVTPVYDTTGRTILYSTFRVVVSCELNRSPLGVEPVVKTAVALLTQPGKPFRYMGRHLNAAINLGGARDCQWGPKPAVVKVVPHGLGVSAHLTFAVEFAIPTCSDGRYDGPMEFAYKVTNSIDRMGLTTRRYAGFLRIAQNRPRGGGRKVLRSADEWREKINPPLLTRFRRIPGEFTLSEDKCRLDFAVTDEELPSDNVLPEDVIEADVRHSYRTASPGRVYEWVGEFAATYTIPKGNGLGVFNALKAYRNLVNNRLAKLIEAGQAGGAKAGKLAIIPVSFTAAQNDVYGHETVTLEMQYRLAGASLADVLNLGGLWQPVPGSEKPKPPDNPKDPPTVSRAWEDWVISVKAGLGPRGLAGLRAYTPGEEELVDLCVRIPADPPQPKSQNPPPRSYKQGSGGSGSAGSGAGEKLVDGAALGVYLDAPPEPGRSWLTVSMSVEVTADSGVVVGKTLPTAPIVPASSSAAWDAAAGLPVGTLSAAAVPLLPNEARPRTPLTAGETFVHRRATPTVYVILRGDALRAGHPIPCPQLVSWGGKTLVPANRAGVEGFAQKIVGYGGLDKDYPIYGARWELRYVLLELPDTAPATANNNLLT